MQVKLLSYTQNPKAVIYACARQCYSKLSAYNIYVKKENLSKRFKEFITHLIERGHLSPLEHVSFTFSIEGISRVCTHQLVRHRIASYSQQSQRYVDMENFNYIIPPTIKKNKEAKKVFLEVITIIREKYRELKEILGKEKTLDREKLNQDLRFILPQAVETKIVVTMNCRELLHFFSERLCLRAQWEIRALAYKMFSLCKRILPEVFSFAGPKCKRMGFCPEKAFDCPLFPDKLDKKK